MRKLDYEKLTKEIQNWIKSYIISANLKGIVVGLSGGIDSAVTSGLCVKAVGKENVIGIGLPCESISQDLEDAKLIANFLGISFLIVDLTSTYRELVKALPPDIKSNKMTLANIKPRLRMTTLYSIGQSMAFLVGGTGNRSELAIGYFTKFGDGGVDIEPLGALYKCEVREIARTLKIPERIIQKPPSAGLWAGQTDEGEIGITYDVLDEIIYRLDNSLSLEGLNSKFIEKIRKMMKLAEHKNSMPPTFKVT